MGDRNVCQVHMEMSFILFAVQGVCQFHIVVEDRSKLYTKVS